MSKENDMHCLWHHNINTWKNVVALSFSQLACHLMQELFPSVKDDNLIRKERHLFLFVRYNALILGTFSHPME